MEVVVLVLDLLLVEGGLGRYGCGVGGGAGGGVTI